MILKTLAIVFSIVLSANTNYYHEKIISYHPNFILHYTAPFISSDPQESLVNYH